MDLHVKYRPSTLQSFYGNTELKKQLSKLITNPDSLPHAIVFHGPSGCGKTTLARLLANQIDAEIVEKNSADDRGVEAMREIVHNMHLMPIVNQKRVYIFDEAHALTGVSQESLLKGLEEPPNHVYFFICSTEPQKIIKTVKNRCTMFEVQPLKSSQMMELIENISKQEEYEIDEEIVKKITKSADGSPRKALVILGSIISSNGECDISGLDLDEKNTSELCDMLLKKSEWSDISAVLSKITMPEESIRRYVLAFMNRVLLGARNENFRIQAAVCIEYFSKNFFDSGKAGLSLACFYCVYEK